MNTYKIAAIPADGIGPEVIAAGTEVLAALAEQLGDMTFEVTTFEWGSDYYKKKRGHDARRRIGATKTL